MLFRRILRILRNLFLIFIVFSIVWVVLARFIPIYVTPLMAIRSVESMVRGEMPKNSKTWVPIEEISPNMVQAVVASEDNLFLTHHGFSFNDIGKAIEHNQSGKKIRGGSTISQQTAKNVFLWPQSSWYRKGIEVYFTVLIEAFWSKDRILEVYLNSIEMGKGIYGAEAVAKDHFKTTAAKLSAGKAALIAASLPSPLHFNSQYPSRYLFMRQAEILQQMRYIELPKNK